MSRKIIALTGIRSDYDLMSDVYRAISCHKRLELKLIVTGAHLSAKFGYTYDMIMKDGFAVADKIFSLFDTDEPAGRLQGLGVQVFGLVQALKREKPDLLLVLGDREEAMSAALASTYFDIPLAHVGGGDRVVGNIDDQVRHSVSKLAHIHFPLCEDSAQRLIKLGEQSFRIYNFGNPGLDRFLNEPVLSKQQLKTRLNFNIDFEKPLIIVVQHVLSSEIDDSYSQMKITLESLVELGFNILVTSPNSDAGSSGTIRAIHEFTSHSNLKFVKTLPRTEFVNVLRNANLLVGNSSMGFLEAPFLKLPVVNVGNRQTGRFNSGNVRFVPHSKEEIQGAVKFALFNDKYKSLLSLIKSPFGDGHTSKKIANKLAEIKLDKEFRVKDITY